MYSESVEEYLKTISRLGGDREPVAVHTLSQSLGVSSVSAHEMVKRLAEQKLVTYQPYKGISLAPAGRDIAGRVQRRHRLWERFLSDSLGLSWAQVHEEAGRLEHATSPAVTEKLAEFLDNPDSCPHGYPIAREGESEEPASRPQCRLSDLEIGARAAIVCVPEDDLALLAYLDQLGLHPQTQVEIVDVAPFEGPITLRVAGQERVIAYHLAARIVVEPAPVTTEEDTFHG